MSTDSNERLAACVKSLPVPQLALWCMSVLDPCFSLVDQLRTTTNDSDVSKRTTVTLVTGEYILINLVKGNVTMPVYKRFEDAVCYAESLDFCTPPYNSAGHAIYAFMTQLDGIVFAAMDNDMDYASEQMEVFPIYLKYISSATGRPEDEIQTRALKKCAVVSGSEPVQSLIKAALCDTNYFRFPLREV